MSELITISEETYEFLTKLKGKLMTETGENKSYDDAIQELTKEYNKRK